MKCPRCQHETPPDAEFCPECGAKLVVACPQCGSANAPSYKFCKKCGQALTDISVEGPERVRLRSPHSYTPKHLADKILTSKSALEGERKLVTVLFADLKGSMELLADRDPEEARKILDPILELMMEAVHRYEGTVNQVMGDGIMALFGAPLAHEDHAVRACYAALRMQESVKRYADGVRRSHGVEIQIRVGMNSGDVVVRSVGSDLRMDYTAVGQTTHLAARMEQLATPGTIRLTVDTLRLAEGFVEVKPLGPIPVKGVAEPIEVYEATGVGAVRTRLQGAAMRGLTRFVGRDTELEQLRRAQQLAASGRGQVAAIVGEAGVGKSRLVYEFTHSHRLQGWLTLESASVSYGKATSYLPVSELLKGYFKIQDRDDLREIREKLTGKLLTLDRTLEPTLPAFLSLLDVPVDDGAWSRFDPAQRRQCSLDAVKALLLREAREQPLLLIFEDLHWIDSETQALLDGLVESLGSARLFLLVNYRPEYQHGWGSKTYYSQLRLDALPPESAGELLSALLGDDPALEPLKRLLVKRGNPFFIEESIRTLVETGALTRERGAYRLARPIQAIEVPATVQVILAARIDRLPAEDKQLLQTASVIGKDVPLVLLDAVAKAGEDAVQRGLTHLQAAEFVYETRLFPDLEYTFKHALTHEVTYGSLLHERRRSIHARIVETIETLYPDRLTEHIEQLAHHAVRGEVWAKAVGYLHQAAVKATERSSHPEAIVRLDEALTAIAHLPDSRATRIQAIDIRLDTLLSLVWQGLYKRLVELGREAEALARGLEDRLRIGRALSLQSLGLRMAADLHGALRTGLEALQIAAESDDVVFRLTSSYRLGQTYFAMGEYRRAAETFRSSLEAGPSESATIERYRISSRAWLAFALGRLGEFREAIQRGEEALHLSTASGRRESLIIASGCLGGVYLLQGDLEAAVRVLESGLALCRALKDQDWSRTILSFLGEAYLYSGRVGEGLPLIEESVREAVGTGATLSLPLFLATMSRACLLAGRADEACRHAEDALDLACRSSGRPHQVYARYQLAEVVAQTGAPPDRAEALYRDTLVLADELGMRPVAAHCHLGLGKLYRRTRKRVESEEHFKAATTMYREMGMTYWLERAEQQ